MKIYEYLVKVEDHNRTESNLNNIIWTKGEAVKQGSVWLWPAIPLKRQAIYYFNFGRMRKEGILEGGELDIDFSCTWNLWSGWLFWSEIKRRSGQSLCCVYDLSSGRRTITWNQLDTVLLLFWLIPPQTVLICLEGQLVAQLEAAATQNDTF